GAGLDLETDRQIDCKCAMPNLLVPRRILTTPFLRTTIDTARRYCDAFQSIWLDASVSLAELPLEAHPGENFHPRSYNTILAYRHGFEAPSQFRLTFHH